VTAIELASVSKRYWKLTEHNMLIRAAVPFLRPDRSELWALRDWDLRIDEGEVVGVIGQNGAGKTTLLRLIAGVTQPTKGKVRIRGRVAPLISVGVGFHHEMSGRENVVVNGMLLGLSRRQIRQRFDEIVAFAELEEHIDTPVKFYSSGMFMRLGFAVAVHSDPQVLLVDEVLAVGDAAFQIKCLDRMQEIRDGGATIVMVSHFMAAIRLFCPRAIVVHDGMKVFDGPVEEAIAHEHLLLSQGRSHVAAGRLDDVAGMDREQVATIVSLQVLDRDGVCHHPDPETALQARMRVRFERDVPGAGFLFRILWEDGSQAYAQQTPMDSRVRPYQAGDEVDVVMHFVNHLAGGTFHLTGVVTSADGRQVHAADPHGFAFFVERRMWTEGPIELGGHITIDDQAMPDPRTWRLGQRGGLGEGA
jgi:lipopolysaccharide transport system ATP-binding protein